MTQDLYHKTEHAVSVVLSWLPVVLVAFLLLSSLSGHAFAAGDVTTKQALITKGQTVSSGFTEVIKGWAKPIGSIVFIVLFLLMMFVGKQILAKFGYAIIAIIGVVMSASIVAVIWSISGGT